MSPTLDLQQHSHRRLNILTGQWILVAPYRTQRPWQGQIEKDDRPRLPQYDPTCYLCPGNSRSSGAVNPQYNDTFVFRNDFSSLAYDSPAGEIDENNLLQARSERGDCRVLCFSPRHDLTLPEMKLPAIRKVIDAWTQETDVLGRHELCNCVIIFENKGAMMGCSNPHPHCQIWACECFPREYALEISSFQNYFVEKKRCILCDYLLLELKLKERIVIENEHFVVLVPFWAIWPYEVILLSKRHLQSFLDLTESERNAMADIIHRLTIRYDNLFLTSFPYSMGFHQAPTDGKDYSNWHFHAHYYPPLLRSAKVKKFMVGFEMLGTPMRDISPEVSANRLRGLSEIHYSQN